MILPPGPIFGDQELRANAWNERPSSPVTGSLWNTVPSITLEHSYFWIALEHKMIHFVLPLATVDTQNIRFILRRSTLEASRVPKRSLYQKKAPIPDFALTSSLPLSCLLLLPGLGIHCAQLLTNLGFIWEGRSVPAIYSNNHLGFIRGGTSTYIIISAFFRQLEQTTQPTLRALTSLLRWPSLCSHQPFRVYLRGRGEIHNRPCRVYLGEGGSEPAI